MIKFLKRILIFLPTRWSLSYAWNLGSLLGIIVIRQILSGTLLALFYNTENPFERVQFIIIERNYGWLLRLIHFNGARFLFLVIYLHIFKALFTVRYRIFSLWLRGIFLLLGFILVAFAGYVLVIAQIRFWAAVVITSLLGVIPYLGGILIFWIWGGFIVGGATLKLFFVIHFLVPYILLLLILIHLIFLHKTGSSNSLIIHGWGVVPFFPYYWIKDLINLIVYIIFLILLLLNPFTLGDPEIFLEANPIRSPVHIIPEWYFLFAYAILRAIPLKWAGVVALLMSILSLITLSFSSSYLPVRNSTHKLFVWIFLFVGIILRWLGQCHVEVPFTILRALMTVIYFILIIIIFRLNIIIYLLYRLNIIRNI